MGITRSFVHGGELDKGNSGKENEEGKYLTSCHSFSKNKDTKHCCSEDLALVGHLVNGCVEIGYSYKEQVFLNGVANRRNCHFTKFKGGLKHLCF